MMGLLSYLVFFAIIVLILGIVTLGLNLQWGFTGLFNAGIVGFYAVGGYAFAIICAPPRPELLANMGLPWIVGIVGAMAASAMVALIVGLATIRLRGDYLAISTFGVAVTIQLVTLNWEALTGGSQGMTSIPGPFAGLVETGFTANLFYLILVGAAAALIYWGLERILRSPWGRVLKAIREDETAAIALGKDARLFRLQAFIIGSTIMGFAGALYVSFIGFVSPFDFAPILTFQIWAMLIVGGSGNNRGALMGTAIIWALWSVSGVIISKVVPAVYLAQSGAIQTILIGAVLVCTLLFRPRGLIGEEPAVSRHVQT